MQFASRGDISAARANIAVVCLLTAIQEEGDDQAFNLLETIQVSWKTIRTYQVYNADCGIRVGDIVDIKANGAVQKG